MEHLDPEQIVLLALGEQPVDKAPPGQPSAAGTATLPQQHLLECGVCRDELAQLTRTVGLAREAGEVGLQAQIVLPASIWNGIAAELGIGSARGTGLAADVRVPGQRTADAPRRAAEVSGDGSTRGPARRPADDPSRRRRPRRTFWRRGLVAAALVVAIGGGVGAGVAIGRRETPTAVAAQLQAVLRPMPAGPATAYGTATVTLGASDTLTVVARRLPLRQGFYQVWLYNPQANKMVAVGTLGAGGDGIWTLASTIDLRSYSVVDVSAQNFDGNPAHKDSVLQGPLTQ